jgi:hypothetical protein
MARKVHVYVDGVRLVSPNCDNHWVYYRECFNLGLQTH